MIGRHIIVLTSRSLYPTETDRGKLSPHVFQGRDTMIFEQIATGGCRSYLIGCGETCAAALIDPELSQIDRYLALASHHGLRVRYLIDTHTHADHFSAGRQLRPFEAQAPTKCVREVSVKLA